MSALSIAAGTAAVEDEAYFKETVERIRKTRERTAERLSALGFVYPEPSANFIFAKKPGLDAKRLFEDLKAEGIYVRYFPGPRTGDYLRITIGTDAQMGRSPSVSGTILTKKNALLSSEERTRAFLLRGRICPSFIGGQFCHRIKKGAVIYE